MELLSFGHSRIARGDPMGLAARLVDNAGKAAVRPYAGLMLR
jgi:hypothetical protein